MSAPDAYTTEILTEHLGFPPIALIDDIINAVNGIMYKCTAAVEEYLYSHQPKEAPHEVSTEIEHGTAKLETLLENTLDHNFDKFELYALRNILNMPYGLPIRLKHQECIVPNAEQKSVELDLTIRETLKKIEYELKIKRLLMIQVRKAKKIVNLLRIYKTAMNFIEEQTDIRKQLEPLDETIYYLVNLSQELFGKVEEIQNSSIHSVQAGDRERYLGVETGKLLKILGLAGQHSKIDKLLDGVNIEEIKKLYE